MKLRLKPEYRRLQAGCYTLNLNTKLVHSSGCHTLPWANVRGVCVVIDARRARLYPFARPCKFCMTLYHIRVMGMEDRIGWEFRKAMRIGETLRQVAARVAA